MLLGSGQSANDFLCAFLVHDGGDEFARLVINGPMTAVLAPAYAIGRRSFRRQGHR